MTLLYDARYSFVIRRLKNEVKLSTQSADNWIWLGNGMYQIGGFILTPFSCLPVYRCFFP